MKTFLYATDCTKSSTSALKYAYKLSQSANAKLHVLHVFDLLPMVTASVRSREVLINNFRREQCEYLRNYCQEQLMDEFGDTNLEYHALRHESVAEAIRETSKRIKAHLVMIGTASPGSLRGLFSKNIGDELITSLDASLLIIPEKVEFMGYSNLVYATDFEEADIAGLKELISIAQPFEAQIKIIHIPRLHEISPNRKMAWFKELVNEQVTYPNISFVIMKAEDVESGIQYCIEQAKPEALAMMERPRISFWDNLFHRDMVKTMGHDISLPLIVFNKNYLELGHKFTA